MDSTLYNSSAYALLFLRSTEVDPQLALANTGHSEESLLQSDYIEVGDMATMLHNMHAMGLPPGWAARAGRQLGVSAHGALGFAALSAPTLGTALQVMADYHGVRISSLGAELLLVDNRYRFALRDLSGDRLFGQWMCEAVLMVLETLVETVIAHPLGDAVGISFTYPDNDYVEQLDDLYGARCEFNAEHTAISIPASWQHIPSPLYDEATFRSNVAKCREIISAQTQSRDPVQRVRMQLYNHFDRAVAGEIENTRPPSLDSLAGTLHITPRTLIRRLKAHNTSYKVLLEQARKHYATSLLQQARLSVSDIAYLLGYTDPANFGRAFRSWYGTTPATWRRRPH